MGKLEAAVVKECNEWLKSQGWYPVRLRTTVAGIPDWMMLKDGRAVFIEYKKFAGGRISNVQLRKLNKLHDIGFEAYAINSLTICKSLIE